MSSNMPRRDLPKTTVFTVRLRKLLRLKGIWYRELAELTGSTYNLIWRYATGRNEPTISKLTRICTVLNCSADWLIGLSGIDDLPELLVEDNRKAG